MLYGRNTKFLCDRTLPKLCRWLRVLGVDCALDSWESDLKFTKRSSTSDSNSTSSRVTKQELDPQMQSDRSTRDSMAILDFFSRARTERRVILTTSSLLTLRSNCPQSHTVSASGNLEKDLIDIWCYYDLFLSRDNFLAICGKCGGTQSYHRIIQSYNHTITQSQNHTIT